MTKEELKQRVIELLIKAEDNCESTMSCENCIAYGKGADCRAHMFADYLIANGVTIRERGEWILEHGDFGKMICSSCKGRCPTEKKPDPYEDYQITDFYVESDFCPHCGADMRGDAE